jgi:hypothetical protein
VNVSAPFIRRPVATTLIVVAVTLFGLLAYLRLPVSALPNVDFPTVNVMASLPGARAETMAASVATPLEREFSTIDGVTSMTSSSSLGFTSITLQFDLRRDLDSAAQDVQAAIARATPRLPRDMPSPPTYRKVNPADQPILRLALASRTLPLHVLNSYAETRLAPAISTIRGVAQVQVFGSQKYAVRIQLDPRRLAARGVGLDEVIGAVRGANVNLPTGTLYGPDKAFAIQANGQLETAAEYRPLIVAYRNGAPVRLEDLGRVIDGVENDKVAAWFGDQRAIGLAVQKQPGANTVEVAAAVRALLPRFQEELPGAVDLQLMFDLSETVRESVHDVQVTLLLTLALVVMVIFLFLRKVTATLIPSLAMPLALLGTFAVMYLLGYTLDNLSLMALTLSVGFVVDGRDRDAGEHRPPRGARGAAAPGSVHRGGGDRLHHRLHDALAGGRVHPLPLHGRHPGPPLRGIRGDHRGRHPAERRGFAHPHPDAGGAAGAAPGDRAARRPVPRHRARLRRRARALLAGAPRRARGTRGSPWPRRPPSWSPRRSSSSAFRRASCPRRTSTRSWSPPRRWRGSRSTRPGSASSRWPR